MGGELSKPTTVTQQWPTSDDSGYTAIARIFSEHGLGPVLPRIIALGVPTSVLVDDAVGDTLAGLADIDDAEHRRRWSLMTKAMLSEILSCFPPGVVPKDHPLTHEFLRGLMKCQIQQTHSLSFMYRRYKHAVRAMLLMVLAQNTTSPPYDVAYQVIETYCTPTFGTTAVGHVSVATKDGVKFEISKELVSLSKVLSAMTGMEEPWALDIDANTLDRVLEFVAYHQNRPLRPIAKPITRPFRELVDKWDYTYFRTRLLESGDEKKNKNLQLVVTAASNMGFMDLRQFACAALGSLFMKKKTEEEMFDLFGARDKVKPEHWNKVYEQYPFMDNRVEKLALEQSTKAAEEARRRLEFEVAAEAKQRSKKDALKALKQSLADVKTEEAKGRREVEGEHTKQTAALREERTKDAARVARLVKAAQQKIEATLEKKEEEEEKAAEPSKKPKKKKKPKHVDVVESPPPPPVVASATARFDPFEAPPRRTADMSLLTSVIGPPQTAPRMEPLGAFKSWSPI